MTAAARLWQWFGRHARDLPWRTSGDRDPYRVWLAEIMLQQTQVVTVIPYYQKFLARYPTLADMAAAPLADILADWAGLGYYSRARYLHACAQYVTHVLGGVWPRTAAGLKKLPGVGDYTAAAIAALAFGENTVALDGNVARVLSRYGALAETVARARGAYLALGDKLIYAPARGGSAEALIELGALICTPKNPACGQCPLHKECRAHQLNMTQAFPVKVKATAAKRRAARLLILSRSDGQIFTVTRSDGLFAGMLALPANALGKNETEHILHAVYGEEATPVGEFEHILTHIRFRVTVLHLRLRARDASRLSKLGQWLDATEAYRQMPKLFGKALQLLAA